MATGATHGESARKATGRAGAKRGKKRQPAEPQVATPAIDLKVVKRLASTTCTHGEIASMHGITVEKLLEVPGYRKAYEAGRGLAGVAVRKRLWDKATEGNSKALDIISTQFFKESETYASSRTRAKPKRRSTSAVYRERVIDVGRWMAAGLARSEAEDLAAEKFDVTRRMACNYAKDALALMRKYGDDADPEQLRGRALACRDEILRRAMDAEDYSAALRAADSRDEILGVKTSRFVVSGPKGGPIEHNHKHEHTIRDRAKNIAERFKRFGIPVPDRIKELSSASRN